MSPESSQCMRLQGCFVSDGELERLINFWKRQTQNPEEEPTDKNGAGKQLSLPNMEIERPLPGEKDEFLGRARWLVVETNKASTTLLERKLQIGYDRATRIIAVMEKQGDVGPLRSGNRGREVLITKEDLLKEKEKDE